MNGWQVERIKVSLFGARSHYPLFVTGRNRFEDGREFAWFVPNVANVEYDLSAAVIDDDARALLGREVPA